MDPHPDDETLRPPGELPGSPPRRRAWGVGERFGPYALEDELGRGGMGVVFRARQLDLDRPVALKLITGDVAQALVRFEREAQAVARLTHPNVVQVHAFGEVDGTPYLAMDLVEGESLAARLKRDGPLEPRAAARCVRTLAEALEHAHGRGILHRDIKPANVLEGVDGRLRLTDFGLAHDARQERVTRTGELLGTPAYMSPEQADGDVAALDVRADVYSLGATLFALLSGRPPFEGTTAINVVAQVLQKVPPAPSTLRPGIDPDLDAICARCLEKEPARRYPSAEALADDLGRYERHEPVEARPVGRRERLGRWTRRNPLARRAALAGGLLLGCGLLGLVGHTAWTRAQLTRLGAARRAGEATRSAREDAQEAERRAERAEHDRRVDALAREGWAALRRGGCLAALTTFESAAADAPDRVEVWRGRALCNRRLRRWPQVLADADRVLAERPRDYACVMARGEALYSLRRWEEAAAAFGRALALAGSVTPEAEAPPGYVDRVGTPGQGFAHYRRGQCLARAGSAQEAEAAQTRAIARLAQPRPRALAHDARGLARCRLGAWARALEDFERALQLDPNQVEAQAHRVDALWKLGRRREALTALERGLKRAPRAASLLALQGKALCSAGRLEQARASCDRAIALAPDSVATAYRYRGLIRLRGRDLAGARDDLDRAVEIDPQAEESYFFRSMLNIRAKRYRAALADLDRCPTIVPREVQLNRAEALLRLRRFREALATLEQVQDRDAGFHHLRAQAWIGLKRPDEARVDLRRCLELSPGRNTRASALSLLKQLRAR